MEVLIDEVHVVDQTGQRNRKGHYSREEGLRADGVVDVGQRRKDEHGNSRLEGKLEVRIHGVFGID